MRWLQSSLKRSPRRRLAAAWAVWVAWAEWTCNSRVPSPRRNGPHLRAVLFSVLARLDLAVACERSHARRRMIDDGRRGGVADEAARCTLARERHMPWRMNFRRRESFQLRQIALDELALGIETFRLRHRVEDAEVGLRIATGGRGPLPSAVVGGQVVVVQVPREVALARAP